MRTTAPVVFLCVVLGVFGTVSATWVLIALSRFGYLTAAVALGAAVFAFGLIAMQVTVAARRVAPRASCAEGGLTVRPDRRVDVLLFVPSLAAFLAMTLYAIFAPVGQLDIRAPRGSNDQYLWMSLGVGA